MHHLWRSRSTMLLVLVTVHSVVAKMPDGKIASKLEEYHSTIKCMANIAEHMLPGKFSFSPSALVNDSLARTQHLHGVLWILGAARHGDPPSGNQLLRAQPRASETSERLGRTTHP